MSVWAGAQDPWVITADKMDARHYYGETAANGMLGLVSSSEPMVLSATVLAGCYDKYGRGEVSNFLCGFNFLDTELEIDGQRVCTDRMTRYSQRLDMRHAALEGVFAFADKADVTYRIYSLRQLPFCGMQTLEIVARKDLSLTVRNVQSNPEGFTAYRPRFESLDVGRAKVRLLSSESMSPTGRMRMAACSTFLFPGATAPEVEHVEKDGTQYATFSLKLKKGQRYEFAVVGSTLSSVHHPDPINEVKRLTVYCQMQGVDRLLADHRKEWDRLWSSDIIIEGDAQSQQDVHQMMYHLYAFLREGSGMSVSPMGLSGLGYNGHVFWDAETWMFPPLLLLHPELARSMLDYRYERLTAAKMNAFEHGYRGAMFPWESAESGREDTPVTAMTGPFEHSVTGCVGVAAWQYYCVTGDRQWLREEGYPLLRETADFWVSRVDRGKDGYYHINNVVAADEWAENVDDDAFTNGIAQLNLLCAARAARALGEAPDERWEEVAEKMRFWEFDDGVTREYATYQGQDIKQCDVNLLAFPVKRITDRPHILADLDYYRKRLPEKDTPAMTQAIFALLYARTGDRDRAWYYFKDAYEPNRLPPFGVLAECKGGTNPYFATGAGGALQTVLMGFCGLDIDYERPGLRQVPSVMPEHWKRVRCTAIGSDRKEYVVSAR